ncbi:ArsR family transcriptional regulator [Peptacetobacter hominis]|uniref:ArsR family transcriptional regulator n=1 Tax=Peptacetobacter hominis TaxID=2743610 RepID=A0A544QX44_9FIRM|nr:metalloregulator ArsR/SmtB family transcription factor [Peptacetobacter hominis]TQQ85263.1 ArsR family transcriptional regulator [Peptacetobacter hominis]
MEENFILEKKKFIENYNLARPIMTILGDEVRQEILLTLIETGGTGGIRVGEIQKRSHVSRSAVSHHLKILLNAGIINMRREGTKNYYYIDFDDSTVKPVILFWQQVEPMLKRCIKERESRG